MNTLFRRRKTLIIFMVIVTISLCTCAVIKETGNHLRKESIHSFKSISENFGEKEAAAVSLQPAYNEMKKKPLFILKLVGSELRVINYEDEKSYTVIKTADARTFRSADRLKLIDGIEIYTVQELSQFIEDFSS